MRHHQRTFESDEDSGSDWEDLPTPPVLPPSPPPVLLPVIEVSMVSSSGVKPSSNLSLTPIQTILICQYVDQVARLPTPPPTPSPAPESPVRTTPPPLAAPAPPPQDLAAAIVVSPPPPEPEPAAPKEPLPNRQQIRTLTKDTPSLSADKPKLTPDCKLYWIQKHLEQEQEEEDERARKRKMSTISNGDNSSEEEEKKQREEEERRIEEARKLAEEERKLREEAEKLRLILDIQRYFV